MNEIFIKGKKIEHPYFPKIYNSYFIPRMFTDFNFILKLEDDSIIYEKVIEWCKCNITMFWGYALVRTIDDFYVNELGYDDLFFAFTDKNDAILFSLNFCTSMVK